MFACIFSNFFVFMQAQARFSLQQILAFILAQSPPPKPTFAVRFLALYPF